MRRRRLATALVVGLGFEIALLNRLGNDASLAVAGAVLYLAPLCRAAGGRARLPARR